MGPIALLMNCLLHSRFNKDYPKTSRNCIFHFPQPLEALNMILYLVKVQRKILHSIQYFRLSFFQIENQNEWTIAKSTFLLRWVTLAWEHRPTTKYIIRKKIG